MYCCFSLEFSLLQIVLIRFLFGSKTCVFAVNAKSDTLARTTKASNDDIKFTENDNEV